MSAPPVLTELKLSEEMKKNRQHGVRAAEAGRHFLRRRAEHAAAFVPRQHAGL